MQGCGNRSADRPTAAKQRAGPVDHIALRVDSVTSVGKRSYYRCAELSRLSDDGSGGGGDDVAVSQRAYIHVNSNLYHTRPRPSLIAYNQIISSNCQHFIRECLAIDPLALARIDSPVIDKTNILKMPKPKYLPSSDRIVCFVSPVYTPLDHRLVESMETDMATTHTQSDLRYQVFASALLEGLVVMSMRKWTPLLASSSKGLGGKERASPHQQLVRALQTANVSSRSALVSMWSSAPHFLISEYVSCVRPGERGKVEREWPPVKSKRAGRKAK
mmetsp:Transcript_5511/g.15333  ORF Transcript_5511/g.15333 Transcript_5511/m.15333 type:complete len:274 (+) Transcript_5511:1140-1961(+)